MTHLNQLPDLDREAFVPLYVQLSEIITKIIRETGLSEGDPVPSENDLLERYDVSRTTIRQAFQRLESLDIIRRIRGKGTFVASPKSRDLVRGFQSIEDMLASEGIKADNSLLRCEVTHPPGEWAQHLQIDQEEKVLYLRRIKLADGKPLALEERLLPKGIAEFFTQEDFSHNSICDKIQPRMARVAYFISSSPITKTEADELNVDSKAPIIRRVGTYYDKDGQPIMFSRVTFLADKVELRFDFYREDQNWGLISVTQPEISAS
jgi:GntR family transcriptional regulator